MRTQKTNSNTKVWLSANDTYDWANRIGRSWPCSQLSGKRVFAEFAENGDLVDITINGKNADCDANEFNAIMTDLAEC